MKSLQTLAIAAALVATASNAYSAEAWQRTHPRVSEVDGRISNQEARVQRGVQRGQLSQGQASQLRAGDSAIQAEEGADAAAHGGHLTRGEQRQINQQENANSRAIFRGRHG